VRSNTLPVSSRRSRPSCQPASTEVRRGGEWLRSDDVYRRFVNGFDADVEPLAEDGVARVVAAIDARPLAPGSTPSARAGAGVKP